MIISIPMTLKVNGEHQELEVDIDVSFHDSERMPYEIHGCFCEAVENSKVNLEYEMHTKAMDYLDNNLNDLQMGILEARHEARWEMENGR